MIQLEQSAADAQAAKGGKTELTPRPSRLVLQCWRFFFQFKESPYPGTKLRLLKGQRLFWPILGPKKLTKGQLHGVSYTMEVTAKMFLFWYTFFNDLKFGKLRYFRNSAV